MELLWDLYMKKFKEGKQILYNKSGFCEQRKYFQYVTHFFYDICVFFGFVFQVEFNILAFHLKEALPRIRIMLCISTGECVLFILYIIDTPFIYG